MEWLYSNECDINQARSFNRKRTCFKDLTKSSRHACARSGMSHSSDQNVAANCSEDRSPHIASGEHRSLETGSDSFHMCLGPASVQHQAGFCFFLFHRELNPQMPQVSQQVLKQRPGERAVDAPHGILPPSDVGTQPRCGLGQHLSSLSRHYNICQVFRNNWFLKQVKDFVGFSDKNGKYTQVESLRKYFPLLKKVHLNLLFGCLHFVDKVRNSDANLSPGHLMPDEDAVKLLSSNISVHKCATHDSKGCRRYSCTNASMKASLLLRQSFMCFPAELLQLQLCSQEELLQCVSSVLPELCAKPEELKGVYWIAVGNYKKPGPEPACLLLLSAAMYAIVPSTSQRRSSRHTLDVFQAFSFATLREIQMGYAGQNIRLLCADGGNAMSVFTFHKDLTQRICYDILSIVASSLDHACLNHPLLTGDLLQLSLDWTAKVPDLVFESGLRLSCSFEANLADLVYLLHENMKSNQPPLGEVQVLLYTAVKLEGNISSLVLTNSHIGLLQEEGVIAAAASSSSSPAPRSAGSLAEQSQLDRIQCRCLRELRCAIVSDKENLTEIELVFCEGNEAVCDSANVLSRSTQRLLSSFCHLNPNVPSQTWKLTFSSSEDAIKLMSYLTVQ